MKLWIIIALMGKVAETIGPVPFGMDECLQKVAAKDREIDVEFADPKYAADPRSWLDGYHLTRADIKISCMYALERPVKP